MLELNHKNYSSSRVWEIAEEFKTWVWHELEKLKPVEREPFLGYFCFIVDDNPRFVLFVQKENVSCHSFCPNQNEIPSSNVVTNFSQLPSELTLLQKAQLGTRATISTSSLVLEKLLQGKMRAKIAFLTGRVVVEGDLPSFLKMVGLLKSKGVSIKKKE